MQGIWLRLQATPGFTRYSIQRTHWVLPCLWRSPSCGSWNLKLIWIGIRKHWRVATKKIRGSCWMIALNPIWVSIVNGWEGLQVAWPSSRSSSSKKGATLHIFGWFVSKSWLEHPKNSWSFFQIQISQIIWGPQGPQGCLKKQNHPLSSNLVVWCTKIQPKTKNLWKNVENPSFYDIFLWFLRFFQLYSI